MSSSELEPNTAWLYVRGEASVYMEARPIATGFELSVVGPGTDRRTLHAADAATLLKHQAQLGELLVADGYVLQSTGNRRRFFRPR